VQRILNVLAWIGTALVFGAAAVRILGFTDSLTVSANVDRYAMYASWAGLALVVLYTLAQWRSIVEWFGGRNARYGTLAGVSVIVGLGILVAANYLSNRQNKRWDLTSNKQYSLSDQTVKLLQDLKSPVKFLVFDRNTNFERFRTRLTAYEYQGLLQSPCAQRGPLTCISCHGMHDGDPRGQLRPAAAAAAGDAACTQCHGELAGDAAGAAHSRHAAGGPRRACRDRAEWRGRSGRLHRRRQGRADHL